MLTMAGMSFDGSMPSTMVCVDSDGEERHGTLSTDSADGFTVTFDLVGPKVDVPRLVSFSKCEMVNGIANAIASHSESTTDHTSSTLLAKWGKQLMRKWRRARALALRKRRGRW